MSTQSAHTALPARGFFSSVLRRHRARRAARALIARQAHEPGHDPQRLERIAAYARGGYFNLICGSTPPGGMFECPSDY